MTGPEGETHGGYWQMQAIDKPNRIDFANGLAGPDGEPTPEMPPMSGHVTFEAIGTRTKMTAVSQLRRSRANGKDARHGYGRGNDPSDRPDRRTPGNWCQPEPTTTRTRQKGQPHAPSQHLPQLHGEHRGGVQLLQVGVRDRIPRLADLRMGDMPPSPGQPELSEAEKEMVMHVELPILAGHVIMGTDMLESLGHERRLGNSMTINLELEDRSETERLFKLLSDGGSDQFGLMDMPWGAYWGNLRRPVRDPVDVQLSEPTGWVASKPAGAERALRSDSAKRSWAGSNLRPDAAPEIGVLGHQRSASVNTG